MLEKMAAGCAGCAALSLVALSATGHPRIGIALAVGLLLGAANGYMARRALAMPMAFGATSLMRLVLLSGCGLAVAALLGLQTAPFVIGGIAMAQLLLAGAAAWQVTRR